MKKLITAAIAATLMTGTAFSVAAAPLRGGANVDEAEGAVSTLLVAALVAIAGTATIVAIESAENNDAPASA